MKKSSTGLAFQHEEEYSRDKDQREKKHAVRAKKHLNFFTFVW